jgi:hypothetical protein
MCTERGGNNTDDLTDLEYLDEKDFWELNKLYKNANQVILRIIDITYYIGIKDLYSSIVDGSQDTLRYLQEIIDLMEQNNIPLPDEKLFGKFPISENEGWGREFTRDDVFNEKN